MNITIKKIISNGCVFGNVKRIVFNDKIIDISNDSKINNFKKSLELSMSQINNMENDNKELSDYLTIQKMIISDIVLEKKVIEKINTTNTSLPQIIIEVMNEYIDSLKKSNSSYLKERVSDLEDVTNRLIANLEDNKLAIDNNKYIFVVDKLYPSLLISYRDNIIGVIAKEGGYTSHAAILCRSLDIPFVVCDMDLNNIKSVIIDTGKNLVIGNPSDNELLEFNNNYNKRISFEKKAVEHNDYLFLANVSSNLDLKKVIDYNFDGVGLYRTEMIFMNLDRPYTISEQYDIYLEAINLLKGKMVCFRTFDVGDDKVLPYLKTFKKGIDNYKNNPQIFINQIKALLMANINNDMRIMFPMIETNEEFVYLKNWVIKINEELNCNLPKIGMMLETKKALENITDFKDADFISIGTNDLTMELYNSNRDNSELLDTDLFDLINKLKKVVDFCDNNNICLSVCGELASVREIAYKLYEIGIKNLSVSPSRIRTLNSVYTDYIKNSY